MSDVGLPGPQGHSAAATAGSPPKHTHTIGNLVGGLKIQDFNQQWNAVTAGLQQTKDAGAGLGVRGEPLAEPLALP